MQIKYTIAQVLINCLIAKHSELAYERFCVLNIYIYIYIYTYIYNTNTQLEFADESVQLLQQEVKKRTQRN